MDLNLYPRHFEPLFREFFGKAALFCSRQNVEFRPAFLLVLPNTHSKHRYTVMSNHHLRNKELSLKAKGLLSQMLSLPEDWDYTLAGLSYINREKIDAIREAVRDLERAGYIQRSRERDEKGRLRGTDYIIYEQPPTRRQAAERMRKRRALVT